MATPRFLADEDLNAKIVKATHRLEPTIEFVTVHEIGLSSADDHAVLEWALTESWLVVSHDVNTMKGLAENRITSRIGISGLFLASQLKPIRNIADSLQIIWSASSLEEWKNQIVFLPF